MAIDGTLPLYWDNFTECFTVTDGTQLKIMRDICPPAIVAPIVGEVPLPGESVVRQRILQGGCRVIDGQISSTDGVLRFICIYVGIQTSVFANMGAVSITATNTINRTVGDFTKEYDIGDQIILGGSSVAANNGVPAIITTVTAAALTVNGAPFTNNAAEGAGFRIFETTQLGRLPIPITAGTDAATPSVPLLGGAGGTLIPLSDNYPRGIMLGPNSALFIGMFAAVSALPAQVEITGMFGMY
jgi:hypothetical protein